MISEIPGRLGGAIGKMFWFAFWAVVRIGKTLIELCKMLTNDGRLILLVSVAVQSVSLVYPREKTLSLQKTF